MYVSNAANCQRPTPLLPSRPTPEPPPIASLPCRRRDLSNVMADTLRASGKGKHGKEDNTRHEWGNPGEDEDEKPEVAEEDKVKADFGLSGALAKDEVTGNTLHGIVLKFVEPADARPPTKRWRFYVFKGDSPDPVETLHVHRLSAYLVGREKKICDMYMRHPSLSKQHAVLQFRAKEIANDAEPGAPPTRLVLPYIMDLGSTNGTFLNGERIEAQRYIELREQDALKFGESSREYVLLHDKSED